jgi:hypothetical protein
MKSSRRQTGAIFRGRASGFPFALTWKWDISVVVEPRRSRQTAMRLASTTQRGEL